ncbi:hypothetical protein HanRHA438_Chr01g0038221 [Helianthus annuus]|nr:hypothetical protein HanRHA438_Chr01g0038221 [Helianthus annuus]
MREAGVIEMCGNQGKWRNRKQKITQSRKLRHQAVAYGPYNPQEECTVKQEHKGVWNNCSP